jgi:hypothetical protein
MRKRALRANEPKVESAQRKYKQEDGNDGTNKRNQAISTSHLALPVSPGRQRALSWFPWPVRSLGYAGALQNGTPLSQLTR